MQNKLVLVDGSSLLSTSFFGTLPREWYTGDKEIAKTKIMKTADGRYTNGVFGMMKILLKIIKEQQPSHLVVAWDVNRDTFRREIYPEYKAHRGETTEELKSQFPLAMEVLKAMNIAQYSAERFEADDIIGTLAKKFEQDVPVYIMTKDQDALQLITENTKVWLNTSKTKDMVDEFYGEYGTMYKAPDNFFEFTNETFEHFYGLKPIQIIDLKALEGDTSDNIPGVKGVGPKAIIPLLKEFGTVEEIYDYIEDNEEKEIKAFFKELGINRSPLKNLIEGKDLAFISKTLATIKTDMNHYDDMTKEHLSVNIDEMGMLTKFKELQFNSLIKN